MMFLWRLAVRIFGMRAAMWFFRRAGLGGLMRSRVGWFMLSWIAMRTLRGAFRRA